MVPIPTIEEIKMILRRSKKSIREEVEELQKRVKELESLMEAHTFFGKLMFVLSEREQQILAVLEAYKLAIKKAPVHVEREVDLKLALDRQGRSVPPKYLSASERARANYYFDLLCEDIQDIVIKILRG